jgi:hypothetical protein
MEGIIRYNAISKDMDVTTTIQNIKKELRANMNGVASSRIRESGLAYHVNFGIELPRLQIIANEFEPNHEVAQQLWHENVRESKILAAMLMPIPLPQITTPLSASPLATASPTAIPWSG